MGRADSGSIHPRRLHGRRGLAFWRSAADFRSAASGGRQTFRLTMTVGADSVPGHAQEPDHLRPTPTPLHPSGGFLAARRSASFRVTA